MIIARIFCEVYFSVSVSTCLSSIFSKYFYCIEKTIVKQESFLPPCSAATLCAAVQLPMKLCKPKMQTSGKHVQNTK